MKFSIPGTRILLFICVLLSSQILVGQSEYGLSLVSQVKLNERASDIWGWVDYSGTEYALLGSLTGFRIYNLTDPSDPKEEIFISGPRSKWRDVKTWDNYAYVSTEADTGIMVVDLRDYRHWYVNEFYSEKGDTHRLDKGCHNLFIDERGYLYLIGCGNGRAGWTIFDLNTNPEQPVFLGQNHELYAHDIYVEDGILYAANIYFGQITIHDVTDPYQPEQIGEFNTPNRFAHNCWLDKQRQVLYTTDERVGSRVAGFDVSDPESVVPTDAYIAEPQDEPMRIPHNAFYKDDKLYVSYYTDGVQILDVSDPYNIVLRAYYIRLETSTGFSWCLGRLSLFTFGTHTRLRYRRRPTRSTRGRGKP